MKELEYHGKVMALLEIKDLKLWYGDKQVLFDVNFSLGEGEILCIVGESGSGKSSILYSVMGLLPNYARVKGKIIFEGEDLLSAGEEKKRAIRGRKIGMVFQEPSAYLDPLFTVGSQVEEAYRIHFPEAGDSEEKALQAMKKAGIPDPQEKYGLYPHQLSGGLKQRVCIATALVCDPPLILADEPTTALDVSVQKRILNLFLTLKEEGRSIILVTHDFGVVAQIADNVIVLKEGRIVERGSVFEIFDNPKDPYTKQLLEAILL